MSMDPFPHDADEPEFVNEWANLVLPSEGLGFMALVINFLMGSDLTLEGMVKSMSISNNVETFFADSKPQP